jgi:hypothetical protein
MGVDVMEELEKLSREFGRRANMLTDGIWDFQAMLQALPGQVSVRTEIGDGKSLAWGRHEKQWTVLHCIGDSERPLTSCSVEDKAYASKYLGCLCDDIEKELRRQSDLAAMGLGALKVLSMPEVTEPEPCS